MDSWLARWRAWHDGVSEGEETEDDVEEPGHDRVSEGEESEDDVRPSRMPLQSRAHSTGVPHGTDLPDASAKDVQHIVTDKEET